MGRRLGPEQGRLGLGAKYVADHDVSLLNHRRGGRGRAHHKVAFIRHRPAVGAGQAQHLEAFRPRGPARRDDIGRAARSGNADKQIAFLA